MHDSGMGSGLPTLIIENNGVSTSGNGEYGMGCAQIGILKDNDSDFIRRIPQPFQGKKLGNGVILAITPIVKELLGNGPVILPAIIIQIKDIFLFIDIAIDLKDLLLAGQPPNGIKKLEPSTQMTLGEESFRTIPLRHILKNMAFKHTQPLGQMGKPVLLHGPVTKQSRKGISAGGLDKRRQTKKDHQ